MADQKQLDTSVKISFLLLFLVAISIIMIVQPYQEIGWLDETVEEEIFQVSEQQEEPIRAELYVLRATISKNYPCYHCQDSDSIFLAANEVWKYGVLVEEENEQYTDEYLRMHSLTYFIQFEGTLEECTIQEQNKISSYALLSENLRREHPLLKPPGNK